LIIHVRADGYLRAKSSAKHTDDAKPDRCRHYCKQVCRFVKYLILAHCHLILTFKFVYSDVRIYANSDKCKSGITPINHLMSKNLVLFGKALQNEALKFHLNL